MSKAGETLQVGDEAWTDYSGQGLTLVRITGRREGQTSQSRVTLTCEPRPRGMRSGDWIDSHWFDPAPDGVLL